MRNSGHADRARQHLPKMLQSVACLVGSGKTVSARAAIAALDQTRHTLIYLADPTTGTRGIHHQVVTALGGRPAHGSATLAAQAAALIAAEHGERGRVPLLVIDEAHLLAHDQLEAVRILTNTEMDAASPLACLLIGQPTLRRMLRLGVLAALVILSFRVSQGRDLRLPVADSVVDGTLAA
jgi:type II secretory pathway predicted ATPase ExeA